MPFFGSLASFFGRVLLVVAAILSEISTLSGAGISGYFDGTPSAQFNSPWGLAVDSTGNVYVADHMNDTIRKITPQGLITTLAGTTNGYLDGRGIDARLSRPQGIAVDSSGNIYFSENSSHRIRKITPAGIVTTIAGSTNPSANPGSSDSIQERARFSDPYGVAVDLEGNVYVADQTNNRIRKITSEGVVTTLAGTTQGFQDGTGTNASFFRPRAVAVDSAGNVYVADTNNNRIRKITSTGVVTTLAGSGTGQFADGTGTNASFFSPHGVAVDSAGNVYVADYTNQRIRKITPAGVVTTLAGSGTQAFADGTGTNASFFNPIGVAVDSAGNVYVSDYSNNRIRKITPDGVVTTLAGSTSGYTDTTKNGAVSGALLNIPRAVAVDSSSTIYVADTSNNRIRKITSTGVVTTLAGSGIATFADGTGTNASFNLPNGVAVDSSGNVYVGDTVNNRIRKITSTGVVTTLAGSGIATFVDGTGTAASFNTPQGITVDSAGNVYVIDQLNYRVRKITPDIVSTLASGLSSPTGLAVDSAGNVYVAETSGHRIRKITSAGVVTTLAGSGTAAFVDGSDTSASFNSPNGLTIDVVGNLYVADTDNNRIRKITPTGIVTTIAGNQNNGVADGIGTNAEFSDPKGITIDSVGTLYISDSSRRNIRKIALDYVSTFPTGNIGVISGVAVDSLGNIYVVGSSSTFKITSTGVVTVLASIFNSAFGVAVDSAGNVYVGDTLNHRICKITPTGVVTTLAGSTLGSTNGTGTNASFWNPQELAVDSVGNVYVADTGNHRIRKITPDGVVSTLAGSGSLAFADGTGTNASFNFPNGLTIDVVGNLYVADTGNHRIRKITPDGVVSTLAGSGTNTFADGTGTNARFNQPRGVAVDSAGNVYVGDYLNHRIRKITPAGVVTTLAGTGTQSLINGPPSNATFNCPYGVDVDSMGNVYVADYNNFLIRKITVGGDVVTTFAGRWDNPLGWRDGTGTNAWFCDPNGLTVDSVGNVFVADRENNRIRRITPTGVVSTFAGSGSQAFVNETGAAASFFLPDHIVFDSVGNLYVNDSYNNRIRIITPGGTVSTFAGTGVGGFSDGTVLTATFNGGGVSGGLAFDSSGNLYVGDTINGRVRKITRGGIVTTLAGDGTAQYLEGTGASARFLNPLGIVVNPAGTLMYVTDANRIRRITSAGVTNLVAGQATAGSGNGSGASASFNGPRQITLLAAGTSVYVADTGNHIIRRVTTAGSASRYSGFGGAGFIETPVANVQYNSPQGIAVNSAGLVYVADTNNNRIRTIAAGADNTGVVTTFVGTNTAGYSDGGGWFNSPFGVAMDWNGTVYVADTNNNRIRKITSLGVVSTLAGNGLLGQANGTGTNATFFLPRGVALGLDETVYVADTNNNRIRRITAAGVVTTMAGQTTAGSFDGTGTNATFNSPNALTVDFTNTVYVADTGSHCIRRITSGGVVTTFAGTTQGFQDGVGTNASFNTPRGIVVDMYGNFYVADTNNHNIRRITSDGTVTTLAGSTAGYADGTGTNARFNFPTHLSIDALGTLYVADQTNNRIRTVQTSTGVVSTLAGDGTAGFTPSRFNTPQGITLDRFRNAYVADSGNHSIPKIGNAFTLPENNGVVTTFAGSTQGFLDGTGIGARFNFPTGVTVDSAGTFYIADRGQQRIRRITSAGVVTLLAGQTNTGATDGTGAAASFNNPYGITVDSVGNVYVADTSNNRIRRITPAGLVSTLAGSTIGSFNGIGTNATFNGPTGVVVNSEGIMYVADQSNHLIRRIAISGGGVTTLAGTVLTGGSADGTGTNATFSRPSGVAVDSSGTVYVADTDNHRIRKITPAGVVTTLAGSTLGSTNGTGTNAQFNAPTGVAVDSAGNVYVAEQTNHRIRRITPAGVVTTLAGSTAAFANGTGTNAQFNTPYGVAVDSAGNVYVADQSNHLIRKIGSGVIQVPLNRAVVTTFAGNGTPSAINGTGTSATFQFPTGLAVDSVGNIYVGEQNNNRIRRITTTGVVSTLAGSGNATFADGTGAGASFNLPYGVAVDSSGTVYVADTDNHRIRKITPAGVVTTLAGQSTTGNTDGTGTNARFFYPYGVAVDSTGNVYVGDRSNNRIRRITPAGVVTTFAGSTAGSFDGTGTNATFRSPLGVAVDSIGNVYVADSLNYRIRKITPAGLVTTLAGNIEGFVNGTGTNAMFKSPAGVAVDSVGNIYVGDQSNNIVRRITPAGVVTTLAGSGTAAFADGTGVSASFNNPYGVTVDLGGILYVADQNNHRIRKIQ